MQHSNVEKPGTNKPITIEVRGEPLGVVLPEEDGFRFLAVRFSAFASTMCFTAASLCEASTRLP